MKRIIFSCFMMICILLFSACSNPSPEKNADFFGGSTTENHISLESSLPSLHEGNSDVEKVPATEPQLPAQWEWSASGDGYNIATITNIAVVNTTAGLDENGYIDDECVTVYNGIFSERKEYVYPEFIDENGEFRSGIRMILVDVIVDNPDGATSRWKNANGKYENHYSNPYYFNVASVCSLIFLDQGIDYGSVVQCRTSSCSYFSLCNKELDNQLCFELKPNDSLSFQVGFLIGNNKDGSDIDISALGIGLSGSLNSPWIPVQSEENK